MDFQENILASIRKQTFIFDGAMGTLLMADGLPAREAPERWNIERPETVKGIHRRYFEAGSDCVLTNTFGANRLKLRKRGLDSEVIRINTAAAGLAGSVAPQGKFVAGDIGPSGELIAPLDTE